MKLLFVCTANKHRSPTAQLMFRDHYGYEALSAGLSPDSQQVVDQELVDWADKVFCFEDRQKKKLKKRFGVRAVNLAVPDEYDFNDADLVEVLRQKVPQFLD
tara:strand:+ start:1259 stop:1564 length:306 start_codon:yes stop_codon:yes gene_type:complete